MQVSVSVAGLVLCGFLAAPASAALLPVRGTASLWIGPVPKLSLTGTGSGSSIGASIAEHPRFLGPASVPISPTFIGLALATVPSSASLPSGVGAGMNGFRGTLGFFTSLGLDVGAVPLTPIGAGGTEMFSVGPGLGTLVGTPWKSAPTAPIVFSAMSVILAIPITVTATAYDNRTPSGIGEVQFVAPATGSFAIFGSVPAFGVLTLRYLPEPGTWVLLGSGAGLLVWLGRARLRESRRLSRPERASSVGTGSRR